MPNEVANISISYTTQVELPQSYVDSGVAQQRLLNTGGTLAANFNQTSTPSVKKVVDELLTMTGSAVNMDLTLAKVVGAVDGGGQPTAREDLTNRKCIGYRFTCPESNTSPVKIDPTIVNGYLIFGPGGVENIHPGDVLCVLTVHSAAQRPAVAAAAKLLAFTGLLNETIQCEMIFE